MQFPPPSPRQARMIWTALTGLAVALLVALVAGFIWGLLQVLRVLAPVLWPLALAGVIAYLLDPVVDWLEARKVPRTRAIACVFALGLMIVLSLFSSVVPQLITEMSQLAQRIPDYAAKVEQRAEYWLNHPPEFVKKFLQTSPDPVRKGHPAHTNAAPAAVSTNLPKTATVTNALASRPAAEEIPGTNEPPTVSTNIALRLFGTAFDKGTLTTASGWIADYAPKVGSWVSGRVVSWFGVLAGLALVPVYAFYLLLEKRGIESKWTDYLPVSDAKWKQELAFVLGSINDYLIAFFRGQVLVAICDGILYTIGFLIIQLPYAVLVGVIATGLTMIPFIGAIVTCVSALVIMAVTYGDWKHPAMVLAVFGVVQALEGLVISPKIMGDRVGLHPVTIIIAVMAGTTLMGGILGGILAIPLTAALRVIMLRYVWKRPESPAA